jgi:hypothetical protein
MLDLIEQRNCIIMRGERLIYKLYANCLTPLGAPAHKLNNFVCLKNPSWNLVAGRELQDADVDVLTRLDRRRAGRRARGRGRRPARVCGVELSICLRAADQFKMRSSGALRCLRSL